MKALIAELEKAEEGSRESDAAITVYLDILPDWRGGQSAEGCLWIDNTGQFLAEPVVRIKHGKRRHPGNVPFGSYPHYTTSIDAAVTSLPDGCISWTVSDTPGGPTAWLLMDDGTEFEGFSKPGHGTPALALCIASLKARMHV